MIILRHRLRKWISETVLDNYETSRSLLKEYHGKYFLSDRFLRFLQIVHHNQRISIRSWHFNTFHILLEFLGFCLIIFEWLNQINFNHFHEKQSTIQLNLKIGAYLKLIVSIRKKGLFVILIFSLPTDQLKKIRISSETLPIQHEFH